MRSETFQGFSEDGKTQIIIEGLPFVKEQNRYYNTNRVIQDIIDLWETFDEDQKQTVRDKLAPLLEDKDKQKQITADTK